MTGVRLTPTWGGARVSGDFYPDDPEVLPEGSVVDGAAAVRPVHDVADYVIVGSGAAGATTAAVLAERGYSVALVEEGPWVRTREFGTALYPSMKTMWRGMGTQVAFGRSAVPLIQGRCVGGSTTINSAIAWRAPEGVIDAWGRDFGLGGDVSFALLAPHYEALERELNVHAVEDSALGHNNGMFGEAADKMGFESQRIRRYESGCEGSALCLTGCRHGRKLGMNITFVPRALHAGGRIYTQTRVDRIEIAGGRAVGIVGRMNGRNRPVELRLRARRGVFVAASTVQTPNVLRRSGLRARAIGEHFQAHPGVSMAGLFDREVHMDSGAAQGFNSLAFQKDHHIKLESLTLPPELAAARIPGFGSDLVHRLANYGQMVIWAVVIKAEAHGKVTQLLGDDRVRYTPTVTDMARARTGLKILTEMMFAAGAREIWPGVHGMPTSLTGTEHVRLWSDASLDPRAYNFMTSHMFGAARMGRDPARSVVGTDFQSHEARGLYVVDSSVFPTNLGVNPQHTIMAMARLAAHRAADRPLGEV